MTKEMYNAEGLSRLLGISKVEPGLIIVENYKSSDFPWGLDETIATLLLPTRINISDAEDILERVTNRIGIFKVILIDGNIKRLNVPELDSLKTMAKKNDAVIIYNKEENGNLSFSEVETADIVVTMSPRVFKNRFEEIKNSNDNTMLLRSKNILDSDLKLGTDFGVKRECDPHKPPYDPEDPFKPVKESER